MVDILSHVISTYISRITVVFWSHTNSELSSDPDWAALMDGLQHIDAVLSWPVFGNLVQVSIKISTRHGSDVGDEERAGDLRLCLPNLDERGILSIWLNSTWIESSRGDDTILLES